MSALNRDWAARMIAVRQTGTAAEQQQAWEEATVAFLPVIIRLVREHQKQYPYLPGWFDADDVVMEVLLALYVQASSAANAKLLADWVNRLDRAVQRKTKSLVRKYPRDVTAGEMWPFDTAEDHTDRLDYTDLYAAVHALTVADRELVFRRYWLRSSVALIAEEIGKSEMQVRTRLVKIHEELAHFMKAGGTE